MMAVSLKSLIISTSPVEFYSPVKLYSTVESFPSGFPTSRTARINFYICTFPSGALTRVATSLKLPITPIFPSETVLLRISVIKEFFLKTNLPRNLSPFYRITRITFCLSEFPSGIITSMMTHRQEPAAIKEQGQSKFPSGISIQDLQSFAFQSYHSPMVSIYSHFQNNSTFLF